MNHSRQKRKVESGQGAEKESREENEGCRA